MKVIFTPFFTLLSSSTAALQHSHPVSRRCILYSLYSAVELYSSTADIQYTSSTAPLRVYTAQSRLRAPSCVHLETDCGGGRLADGRERRRPPKNQLFTWARHSYTSRLCESADERIRNTMHLCTENIRSCSRSPRSLPSKIHAATPAQNLAAVESLLRPRELRAALPWRSYPKRNRERRPLD